MHLIQLFRTPLKGIDVELNTIESMANCQLRVLAIGGGGYGWLGGGGSGYIQYFHQTLDSKSSTSIRLTVGDYQEQSSCRDILILES